MNMLGLGNQRDIAAGQIKAQMRGDTLAANASMAATRAQAQASRAALGFERMKWKTEAPMRYLTAMTGLMGELNSMGGYNLSPGYVANPTPPNLHSGGAIAASALAAGANTYIGMGGTFGARGIQGAD